MPTKADLPALHRSLQHQACWSPRSAASPVLGSPGFPFPDIENGLCFDTSQPGDVAALLAHGMRAVLSEFPNHVVLERDQRDIDVYLHLAGRNAWLVIGRVAGLHGSFLALGDGGSILIAASPGERLGLSAELIGNGPGFYFGPGCTCYGARCTVENDNSIRVGASCLFSDRIDIRASDSHSLVALDTGTVINPPGSIEIGPSVWIGTAVIVLKGVTVGSGSVLGAQSVVTRDVPAHCVVAGSPARVIRQDTSWHRAYPGSLPGHRFRMTGSGMQPYIPPHPEPGERQSIVQQAIQHADLVAALYRTLLLRDPDQAGLDALVKHCEAGEITVDALIASFLGSEEFKRNGQRFREAYRHTDTQRFTNDVSQYGEVEHLIRRWVNESARHRIVVDVGARGRERSNSYDLMRSFGWRGLLVEANSALIPAIQAEFAGLDMTLENYAVSDYQGEATFHLGVNDDVSSLNEQAARDWGPVAGARTVRVQRLGTLLHEHGIPKDFDLLSLDIEGEDIKVLNDTVDSFGFRPRWIIVEASYGFHTRSLDDLPVSDGVKAAYAMVDQTEANLILRATGADPAPA